jgi:hypothetical protein
MPRLAPAILALLMIVSGPVMASDEPALKLLFGGQKTLLNRPLTDFKDVVRSLGFWKDEVWVGTYGSGIFAIGTGSTPALRQLTTGTTPLLEPRVNCLEVVGGDLWIGTCNGINVIDGKTGAWSKHGKADGVAHHIYHAIRGDRRGQVWVGTTGKGVSRWDGKAWKSWNEKHGLPGGWVNDLCEDSGGRMWAATAKGVAVLEGDRWNAVPPRNGYGKIWSHATALARIEKEMWVGTGAQGLLMWDAGYWYAPGSEASLPSREVSTLLTDREGTLWIGTAAGVVSYRRPGAWKHYGPGQGLEDPHVMIMREGGSPSRLWAGSWSGLVYRYDAKADRWETVLRRGVLAGGLERGGK